MNILGISGVFGHDAAAALIINGELSSFVEEERIIRDKRAVGKYPINAVKWCLQNANLNIEDIDLIAIGWNPDINADDQHLDQYLRSFLKYFKREYHISQVCPVDHHVAHAAYTIAMSGFDECGIVVADGHGEKTSISIGRYTNGIIAFNEYKDVSQSLGHFIGAVSEHCGLGRQGAGKLMGLAGYGQPIYKIEPIVLSEFDFEIKFDTCEAGTSREAAQIMNLKWRDYLSRICLPNDLLESHLAVPPMSKFSPLQDQYRNLAATAQQILTQCMLRLAKKALNLVSEKNLIISGGVALNCSTNGEILRSKIAKSIFIAPASGDAGTALGAAVVAASTMKIKNISNTYTGPCFSNGYIKNLLVKYGISHRTPTDINTELVKEIAANKVVGRLYGNMEVGPRALGNRSILASGNDTAVRDRTNSAKTRELWRPLAPVLLSKYMSSYIMEEGLSPYMLFALTPTDLFKKELPGAYHIDGTVRVQEVFLDINESFYDLLTVADSQYGLTGLLNTSFNNWSEPIICTPNDALRTFYSSSIDSLQLGDFLIRKF